MIIQTKDEVPFDIHSYRCIKYVQDEKGLDKLTKALTVTLKSLEQWRKQPANPVQQFKPRNAFALLHEMEEVRHQLREAEQKLQEKETLLKNAIAPSQWQKLQADFQRAQTELKNKEQAIGSKIAEVAALQGKMELLRQELELLVHENEELMSNTIAPAKWQRLQTDYQQAQKELESKDQLAAQQAAEIASLQELLRNQFEQRAREDEERTNNSVALAEWQTLQTANQRAQNELKNKEQTVSRQTVELRAFQNEVEHLRALLASPQPAQVRQPTLKLRVVPKNKFSEEEVKRMFVEKNFYDRDWNANGRGIQHHYENVESYGEGLVVDHATNLNWQRGGSAQPIEFMKAEEYVRELNKKRFAGYEDWRLPTLEEAMSLIEREKKNWDLCIAPEFGQTQRWIWTADNNEEGQVWVVGFNGGYCSREGRGALAYVRAVR